MCGWPRRIPEEARRLLAALGAEPVWADSLGAKSFSWLVRCVLIDPGAAAMHPSYPADPGEKKELRRRALQRIAEVVNNARLIIVTHYHYDHYVRPWDPDYPGPNPYLGRRLVAKNPNAYINESQRARAEEFYSRLLEETGINLTDVLLEPGDVELPDYEELMQRTASSTSKGRLEAGRQWLEKLAAKWRAWPRFPERIHVDRLDVTLSDEGVYEECGVRVKLLGPHFHGDIYERTGWVTPVLVEAGGHRLLYTSDLMGPLSEDYAYEVIDAKPDVLIADGPATYLPPYMYSKRDLERAKHNMIRILEEAQPALIVWDHHLPREPRWCEKVADVLRAAEKKGVILTLVSWLYGQLDHVREAWSRQRGARG